MINKKRHSESKPADMSHVCRVFAKCCTLNPKIKSTHGTSSNVVPFHGKTTDLATRISINDVLVWESKKVSLKPCGLDPKWSEPSPYFQMCVKTYTTLVMWDITRWLMQTTVGWTRKLKVEAELVELANAQETWSTCMMTTTYTNYHKKKVFLIGFWNSLSLIHQMSTDLSGMTSEQICMCIMKKVQLIHQLQLRGNKLLSIRPVFACKLYL